MRLMITGSAEHWAIENYYRKYLGDYFSACDIFDSADQLSRYLAGSYKHKIFFRTGVSSILKQINHALLEHVKTYKPDAILVFKGIEILPQTLKILRSQHIKLFNYNPDHPFIRTFRSGGGKNIETCIPLYDLHFCYSRNLMKDIKALFDTGTAWLPFGFEMDDKLYQQLEQEPEIMRVCFAGNPDRMRAVFLQQLEKAGIAIDVYGHHWRRYLRPSTQIKIYDAVYGDEFWKVLRRYRVQLNLFRPHNASSHNMRSFEVPAAGGIMLAPDTPEHRVFFEAGKEIFLYDTVTNCTAEIKDLLSKTKEGAKTVRLAARNRSVAENYSYQRRAKDVYEQINSLK